MQGLAEDAGAEAAFRSREGRLGYARVRGWCRERHGTGRDAIDRALGGSSGGERVEHLRRQGTWHGEDVGRGSRLFKVGLGRRPGSCQQVARAGAQRSIHPDLRRGEEVDLLAGAGAGDVEQPLALGGFAGLRDGLDPLVEPPAVAALALDGREKSVSDACVDQLVVRIGFDPVEQACFVGPAGALERRHNDQIPLQTFCVVDGHEVDGIRLRGGRGVELGQALLKRCQREHAGGGFELLEQAEVLLHVKQGVGVEEMLCAEGSPGVVDEL